MWFRNLQVYRFPAPWKISASKLEEQLGRHVFRPASGFEMQTQGWASPRDDGGLVHSVHGHMLLSLCTEKKLLPASVIKEAVKVKAIEAEERQGYKPGRKQLRDLKEEVIDELLPRAFSVRRRTGIWISPKEGWLVIDVGSPGKADEIIGLMNKSIDDFVVERLNTVEAPGTAMKCCAKLLKFIRNHALSWQPRKNLSSKTKGIFPVLGRSVEFLMVDG